MWVWVAWQRVAGWRCEKAIQAMSLHRYGVNDILVFLRVVFDVLDEFLLTKRQRRERQKNGEVDRKSDPAEIRLWAGCKTALWLDRPHPHTMLITHRTHSHSKPFPIQHKYRHASSALLVLPRPQAASPPGNTIISHRHGRPPSCCACCYGVA